MAIGIVIGMAASLPVTLWAIRAHTGSSANVGERATAAPMVQLCPSSVAPAPKEAPAAPVDLDLPANAALPATANLHAANEKAHKRHKSKHAARTAEAHVSAAPAVSVEAQAAAELSGGSGTAAVAPAVPRSAPPPPAAHLEEQAAAELSSSLK